MNKQEALKRIEAQKETLIRLTGWAVYVYIEELIKSLDEPQKVKVPQFVADWIEKCKAFEHFVVSLSFALQPIVWEENNLSDKCIDWLMDANNQELFARAWLDGYEVEEEKKYKITLLNRNDGDLYLVNQNAGVSDKYGYFSPVVLLFTKGTSFSEQCYKLTKKEVVLNGFGWVFNCPGVEIEEVK